MHMRIYSMTTNYIFPCVWKLFFKVQKKSLSKVIPPLFLQKSLSRRQCSRFWKKKNQIQRYNWQTKSAALRVEWFMPSHGGGGESEHAAVSWFRAQNRFRIESLKHRKFSFCPDINWLANKRTQLEKEPLRYNRIYSDRTAAIDILYYLENWLYIICWHPRLGAFWPFIGPRTSTYKENKRECIIMYIPLAIQCRTIFKVDCSYNPPC
jgi:hypothetical protein